jgi:hypothetical protein
VSDRTAENHVNYQERATEFAPGDVVVPFGVSKDLAGRVTAVWPAIGMVDVEFSTGNKRYGVEELQRLDADDAGVVPPFTNSAPGGQMVRVPGGPVEQLPAELVREASDRRVAEAFVKKALYWSGKDRQYRATAAEVATGHYNCPKCKTRGITSVMKPAAYKRREGVSERLLGCGTCMFLIKKSDIINCPDNAPVVEAA